MNYPNVSHAKWCFPTSFITSDLDMCPNVSENGLVSVCHRVSHGGFVMCLLVPQSRPFGCESLFHRGFGGRSGGVSVCLTADWVCVSVCLTADWVCVPVCLTAD